MPRSDQRSGPEVHRARIGRLPRAVVCSAVCLALGPSAFAANHHEAPLISVEGQSAGFTDIFALTRTVGSGQETLVLLAAHLTNPTAGSTEIVAQGYSPNLTEPVAMYPNVINVSGPDPMANAFEPQIAATDERFAVTYTNFPVLPTQPPNSQYRLFDIDTGTPLIDPARLTPPAVFGWVPALDVAGDQFYVTRFQSTTPGATGQYVVDIGPNVIDDPGNLLSTVRFSSVDPRTAVAAQPDGSFWAATVSGRGPGPAPVNIDVQRFDASGIQIGPPVNANTGPVLGFQFFPALAVDQETRAVYIAWQDLRSSGPVVVANRIEPNGSRGRPVALGEGLGPAGNPDVAVNGNGNVNFTYHAFNPETDDFDVFHERFLRNGVRLGGIVQVNSLTGGPQQNASIATLPDLSTLIAWSGGVPGSPSTTAIYGSDLEPPPATGPNTIAVDDFGTPYTRFGLNFDATYNGGPTDANNYFEVAVDPDDLISTNGVLHGVFQGGELSATSTTGSLFPDVGAPGSTAFRLNVSFRYRADANASAAGIQLTLGVQGTLPGEAPATLFDADFKLQGLANQWGDYNGDQSVDAADVALYRAYSEAGGELTYFIDLNAAGDPEIWLDDLRIDLAPVPLPAAVWLLGSALLGLLGANSLKPRRR